VLDIRYTEPRVFLNVSDEHISERLTDTLDIDDFNTLDEYIAAAVNNPDHKGRGSRPAPPIEEGEQRLAAALCSELTGCRTLALHSTHSTARPFALAHEIGPFARTVCPQLSVDALVETGACVGTALGTVIDAIEVECGHQGTEQAAESATQIVWECHRATGALPATSERSKREVPVFRLQHPIPKAPASSYTVCATNFTKVAKGETYATYDDTPLSAEEPFYPVFM
jgi:hypothetical protein